MTININTENKRRIGWILPAATTVVVIVLIIFNWDWFHTRYTHLTHHNFKSGDKVYAKPDLFDSKSKMNSLFVGRLIRPLNETDIDLMNINAQKKAVLKKQINSSLKEYLISTKCYFDKSRFMEIKSAYLGNYIDHAYLQFKLDENTFEEDSFYALSPNKEALKDFSYDFKMPVNYTWANGNHYIFEESSADQEFSSFQH